jgi:hypothetical protein
MPRVSVIAQRKRHHRAISSDAAPRLVETSDFDTRVQTKTASPEGVRPEITRRSTLSHGETLRLMLLPRVAQPSSAR